MTNKNTTTEILFRKPGPEDGAAVARLVSESPPLELNTTYAYLLLCTHFRGTSVVAEADGEIVGFIAGYRPPTEPDALFVWQVAVKESARGCGLGGRMLNALIDRPGNADVRFLTTSVTPSNASSNRLFRSFAEKREASFKEEAFFGSDHFEGDHEEEVLFRIGPLR
jgi:L-2,4-diaminobutyric acid acetyltransferase